MAQIRVDLAQLRIYYARMISGTITIGDVVTVTGFSRHKLKSLFRELPGYGEPVKQARVARQYSRHDLVVLAVCCELDEKYGLKRPVIGMLIGALRNALIGPKTVAQNAYLIINVPTATVQYAERLEDIPEGLLLPLKGIFERIDSHLDQSKQEPLYFGPVSLGPKQSQSSNPSRSNSIHAISLRKKSAGAKR